MLSLSRSPRCVWLLALAVVVATGCDRLLPFDGRPGAAGADSGRGSEAGPAGPDLRGLDGAAERPTSHLDAAPAPVCLQAVTNPPTPVPAGRILHAAPAPKGDAANLTLTPPCPGGKPCPLERLFERKAATDDEKWCDGTPGQYLKHLLPGDTVIVADGEYPPLEILQACGKPGAPIVVIASGKGAVIRGEKLHDGEGVVWRSAVLIDRSRHLFFHGLTVRPPTAPSTADPIRGIGLIHVSNVVVRGCDVAAFSNAIRVADAADLTLDGNTLQDSVPVGSSIPAGLYLDGPTPRTLVGGNTFRHNQGPAIFVAESTECLLIERNLMVGNSKGGDGTIHLDSPRRVTVRSNLIQGSGGTGIALLGTATAPVADVLLSNNTIDVVGDASSGGKFGVHLTGLAGTVRLHNNLIHDRALGHAPLEIEGAQLSDVSKYLASDRNSLHAMLVGGTIIVAQVGLLAQSLATWQQMGFDQGSLALPIEDLVVKPGTGDDFDYHLKAGSEAKGIGLDLKDELGLTLEGKARNPASVDLGCY